MRQSILPMATLSKLFILLLLFFCSAEAFAINLPSLDTMVQNFSKTAPAFMQLITAFAYVMGMAFIFKGIVECKHFGEMRTAMSQEHSIKSPLIYLGVGAALLYLPSTVQVGLTTFWDVPTPYAYLSDTKDPWYQLVDSLVMIIQLIGTIAVIRGLIILSHLGKGGGQQGGLGRAVTHMIAGIFCINIYQFVQAVLYTLGLSQL